MNIKKIEKFLKGSNTDVDTFIMNAERYIKASKENRLMCVIDKVSASGMSRTMKFLEFHKGHIYNFYNLFDCLGWSKVRDSGYFRINGCGMDMVFNTHYVNIRNLHSLGFITKKTCDILSQNTPHKL